MEIIKKLKLKQLNNSFLCSLIVCVQNCHLKVEKYIKNQQKEPLTTVDLHENWKKYLK